MSLAREGPAVVANVTGKNVYYVVYIPLYDER